MVRVKSYPKGIVCLESFWNYNIENRLSVVPILELLGKRNSTRSFHLTCNTIDELKFNLEIVKRAGRYGFRILYLAFHGYPGGIYMPDLKVDMESLATFMGRRFRDWIVYFDSCRTVSVEKERILNFMSKTGVRMVMGYSRRVDWLDAAAMDLLILNWLQHYKNMGRFWTRFKEAYKDLIGITGLKVFFSNNY
jgi:hypothetical protein